MKSRSDPLAIEARFRRLPGLLLSWSGARRKHACALGYDPLREQGLFTPDPHRTLAISSTAGALIVLLGLLRLRRDITLPYLFGEGALEKLALICNLTAVAMCAAAAGLWPRSRDAARHIRTLYALFAVMLFTVAMMEITDAAVPKRTSAVVAVVFGLAVIGLILLGRFHPGAFVAALAPPASLLPLAMTAVWAGIARHPQVLEALLAMFFVFYGYRALVAARDVYAEDRSGELVIALMRRLRAGLRRCFETRATKLAIAALLLAVLLYRFDWAQAARDVQAVSAATVAGVVVLVAAGFLLGAWKWSHALRLHRLEYPFAFLLRVVCIGFFFSSFLPTAVGGDVYRVYRTLPEKGYRSRALSAVVVERAAGLIALFALGGVGAAVLADEFAIARLYCFVLLIASIGGAAGVLALERGWIEPLMRRWAATPAVGAIQHSVSLLRHQRSRWLALLAGSVAFQLTSIGILFLLFRDLAPDASFPQTMLVTAAVGAAAALPISVNGIGVMEGALVAVAVALGLDYNQALIAGLLRRLITVLVSIACGGLYLHESRGSSLAADVANIRETLRKAVRGEESGADREAKSPHQAYPSGPPAG